MCYLTMLNHQVKECSDNIIYLKDKVKKHSDPTKRGIYLLQIEHAQLHRRNLCELLIVFKQSSKL